MSDLLKLMAVWDAKGNDQARELANDIRKALGIKEEQANIRPAPPVQLHVRPEFPQWRIKYDREGNELARRRVDTMRDLEQLFNSEKGVWQTAFVVPVDPNEKVRN